MTIELKGIHHLTAVSAKIRDNKRFYTRTLGMRLKNSGLAGSSGLAGGSGA